MPSPPRPARFLIGKPAIPFSLPTSTGTVFRFKPGGRPVALFFFPAAGTIGCVRQTCQLRDHLSTKDVWTRAECEVIAISGNTVEENAKFVEDYRLPFTVLCDVDGFARKAYGTGRGILGYDGRVTFFIDPRGVIRDIYDSWLNWSYHNRFIEDWLEKIEYEIQPWSKFLDFEAIMEDYDPGTIVGGHDGTLTLPRSRFSRIFSDSETSSGGSEPVDGDDDTRSLTVELVAS